MFVAMHKLIHITGKKYADRAFEKPQITLQNEFFLFWLSDAVLTRMRQCIGPHSHTLYFFNLIQFYEIESKSF